MTQFEKIDFYRKTRGMTGADLERRIGVSHSVYSQWKNGQSKPSPKSIKALAEVFGISVEDLEADAEDVSAAFHEAELTKEEEDELWRKATAFHDFLRAELIKEKRRQK